MVSAIIFSSLLLFTPAESSAMDFSVALQGDSIHWMTLEAVNKVVEKNIKKNKVKEEKLILIDFYTDWCGWCKRLDTETYVDPEVVALMNTYFYAIKFDAEQKDSVVFAGKSYTYKASGSRGTNGFALEMGSRPGGRIGYPTISFLNPMGEKITVEAGFKNAEKMKLTLLYYGEGHYKTIDFVTFQTQYFQNQLTD